MKKYSAISIITIFSLLLGSVVVASPGSAPTGGNKSLPITQLAYDQIKTGGLAVDKLLVGNFNTPTTFAKFTSTGMLGLLMASTDNPTTELDVRGDIRLGLLDKPNHNVCADKDGTLKDCNIVEFVYGSDCTFATDAFKDGPSYNNYNNRNYFSCTSTNEAQEDYSFTVPTGVTSITVELWGSGGAGYGYANTAESPETYSYCFNGSNPSYSYYCSDGASSILFDKANSSTELMRAYGGKGVVYTTPHTGGSGGSSYISTDSRLSSKLSISGSSGFDGSAGTTSSTYNINCSGTNYIATIAGNGGAGGKGGKSGNNLGYASYTPVSDGGRGGIGLDALTNASACAGNPTPNSGTGLSAPNAFHGVFGAGGGGAGGFGGETDTDITDLCSLYKSCKSSQTGFAGGGGAGYTKATLSVNAGETYKIRLSHGGMPYGQTEKLSGFACQWGYHGGVCARGAWSGMGAQGRARISY
jgi:hypothetical protein